MRLPLLICFLLIASRANSQIETIIGEEVPVDTISLDRPQANCASVNMSRHVYSNLPKDFRIENDIVFFNPSQPGIQTGSVDIMWDPEYNEQHCYPVGKRFDIQAKGVIDTLVRVHPKQQNLSLHPDFTRRLYVDTFNLTLQNKIEASTRFGNWRIKELADTVYNLRIYANGNQINSYQAANLESNISLTCVLEIKLGPFWDARTIPLSILTDVSGPYDSVFVNYIPARLPSISKLSMIGFVADPRFDTVAGAVKIDTIQLRLRPTVHDLSVSRLSTPGVAEPALINDTTLIFTKGPTPYGIYHTFGLLRWKWTNFSNLPQSDSEYYNISSNIQQLKPTPESLDWTGPIDRMPVFSIKVWWPDALSNPRLKKGDQLVSDAEILEGQDSIEVRFRSKRDGLGEYYDYYNITFDMRGPDGITRSDVAVALIRLNVLPKAGIPRPISNLATISLWPNPASDILNLESSSGSPTEVSVTDFIGRRIYLAEFVGETRLDISGWPDGVYFVRSGSAARQKLTVQH